VRVAAYYPYGEYEGTASGDDVRFATYVRDSATGLDYAMSRYYSSIIGRFLSPDSYRGSMNGSGDPANPLSWNRYAYGQSDPVNFNDPSGENRVLVGCDYDVVYGSEGDPIHVRNCSLYFWTGGGTVARNSEGPPLAEINRWARAVEKLSNGNDLLHRMLNGQPPGPCQADLDTLQKVLGVTFLGILGMANDANWIDAAYGLQDPASGLFVPGTSDYTMAQQHAGTIAQYVSGTAAGGTTAATALPGSALWGNIYFSSKYVVGLSTAQGAALLMHEAIHALGPDDIAIQTALFGTSSSQVGAASENISKKFLTDCFQ
jgi:RHS repeat-associated protein